MKIIKYYKTIIYLILMSYLLFSPGSALPKTSLIEIPHSDKVIHFFMFFGFVVFWLNDSRNNSKIIIFMVLFFSICFAAISELIQHYYIAGRTGNVYDFLSDFAGLLSGLLVYFYIWKKFMDKKTKYTL